MRFANLLSAVSFTVLVSAGPLASYPGKSAKIEARSCECLPHAVGVEIAEQFGSLISNFSAAVATNLLTTNYVDYSDSVNYLAGIPLGSPTFSSAAAFIGGQGAQPPIGFKVINVDAVTCQGVIAFRWLAAVGSQIDEVQGINILYASLSGSECDTVGPSGWQLNTVFSEFNSAAWIVDIGGSCPPPPPPSK